MVVLGGGAVSYERGTPVVTFVAQKQLIETAEIYLPLPWPHNRAGPFEPQSNVIVSGNMGNSRQKLTKAGKWLQERKWDNPRGAFRGPRGGSECEEGSYLRLINFCITQL